MMALLLGPTTEAEGPGPSAEASDRRILVFSKTTGFRHASIPDAIAAVERLGAANGFAVDATEDSYAEPLFARHLLGGIQFAAGYPDCDGRPARTLELRPPSR